jgi:hypothetical protein
MRGVVRRVMTTAVASGALLAVTATGALAHQCWVADRSAQGSIAVGNSQTWFSIDIEYEFRLLLGEFGTPGGDIDGIVALAMENIAEAGLPSHIAVFGHHTLLAEMGTFDEPVAEALAERILDGHGVEWAFVEGGAFATFEQALLDAVAEYYGS